MGKRSGVLAALFLTALLFSGCAPQAEKGPETAPPEQFKTFFIDPRKEIELSEGQSYRLSPRISTEGEYTIELTSGDETVVTASGLTLTAVGAGNTMVTATASDGTRVSTAELPLTVRAAEKPFSGAVDVFLIAGQSNAVGNTLYDPAGLEEELLEGYSNVLYYGMANNIAYRMVFRDVQPVKAGLGQTENYFGPELGMAQVLRERYNPETGRYACFVKVASNGTNLLDTPGLLTEKMEFMNRVEGNWFPPSAQAEHTPVSKNNYTGGLYRLLLTQTCNAAEALRAKGFSEVHLRGLYWAQGEQDREHPEEYREIFQLFVSDLRRDLAELVSQDAAGMPILIGEISRSFEDATPESQAINRAFIEMQDALPETIPDLFINHTADYDLNMWDEEAQTSVPVGTDQWHWNVEDGLEIGRAAGTWFLEYLD